MGLAVGIVGLPNVGKSTLFNAITNASVEAQNYPFCTIDPHTGVVPVPDSRLGVLAKISGTERLIYATIAFTDIAGLVRGAAAGEGLGNQFLSSIRETAVMAHVVRCFVDDNIVHVHGQVDPLADMETIELELMLADLEVANRAVETQSKRIKSNDKDEVKKHQLLCRIRDGLMANQAVRSMKGDPDEWEMVTGYQFLTAKPVILVANVSEQELVSPSPLVQAVANRAQQMGYGMITVCAALEAELANMDPVEKQAFLADFGIAESGLDQLSREAFQLLGLQTYLTTGVKETRAWTIAKGDTAPQAAGVIHTDFEKGFIRANVVSFDTFVSCGGWKGAKEKGLVRQEGKEYVMQDGDVVEFLCQTNAGSGKK
ncbi:redox-regulated ATPase YchF [bacterium]|nr:redox-regulated ATPase YchF [bacterium]